MNTHRRTSFVFLIVLHLKQEVFTLTCGYAHCNEARTENEGVFTKISHVTNTSRDMDFTITFELCEDNTLSNGCKFVWKSELRQQDIRSLRTRNETLCSWEHRVLSEHVHVFQLQIFHLVTRDLSLMKLSIIKKGFKEEIVRIIHINVLYPPKVTSLLVDGKEVTNTQLIQEGLKTNITCLFDKGNPSAIFRFLDKNGKEIEKSEDHLSHTVSVGCQDVWPTVHCEGSPPQFLDFSTKIVELATLEATPFRVQAYTRSDTGCLLKPMTVNNNKLIKVNCSLSGNPPVLHLKLHLGNEINMMQGNWMLVLQTEEGSANTTLSIIESSPHQVNSLNKQWICNRATLSS